ncbi:MAG: DoxX family protein [Rickettsiales bacterium]|nr:DoxX family protein [Rickettsiales bacterium]
MKNLLTKSALENYFNLFIKYSEKTEHLLLLVARLWIANIFWKSGILKFNDFETAVFLFTEEHPVPFLPAEFAAISAIIFELGCPILLALGFASRLAVLPLIVMTLVIQFTYLEHNDHFYWIMLLGFILVRSAGFFSLDYFLKRKFFIVKN